MQFRIADTFTASLARLTAMEQKAAKTTAFDLQMNPASPGLSFHKLDRAQDKGFWSLRVNADIRIIVHRSDDGILLAYVDHHDDAYKWGERRKIEKHPTTGAMQLVEIRERVEVQAASRPADVAPMPAAAPAKKIFDNLRKYELMAFGVPEDWVDAVRAATDDTILDVVKHLPQEAQEALLRLAVGEKPEPPQPAPAEADPYEHPDSQRRFRVMTNADELRQALEYPWEKWAVFLHPAQRTLVERSFSGPVRVSGSAGTGKTIVALHRAVHLAKADPKARVLVTTFSKALANALRQKVAMLAAADPEIGERITVKALSAVGYDLYTARYGQPEIAASSLVLNLLGKAAAEVPGHKFTARFLWGEWADVVDAWQLTSWAAYRDVSRLGRKTRIGGQQREILWSIFDRVRDELLRKKTTTWAEMFSRLGDALSYDHVVVDECQDVSVAEARFLGAANGSKPDGLFFTGDLAQRIFQQPFSWKTLGIDVRGRSFTLKINYRTSQQIREAADRLLPDVVNDVDGNIERRRGTVSLFDGTPPKFLKFANEAAEQDGVATWLNERLSDGCSPGEIGVFVRSQAELARGRAALKKAQIPFVELSDKIETEPASITLSTMHYAKGLEFRCVAVMACDDDVIPSPERIDAVGDDADLAEVYETERHLLYVACTRARDHLLVTAIGPGSEFLDDISR